MASSSPASMSHNSMHEILEFITRHQQTQILTLAIFSGWSAEKIARVVCPSNRRVTAEFVWDFSKSSSSFYQTLSGRRALSMNLPAYGLKAETGKELSKKPRPVTVSHEKVFSTLRRFSEVFPGYTAVARDQIIQLLAKREVSDLMNDQGIPKSQPIYVEEHINKPLGVEISITDSLGALIKAMIESALKAFFTDLESLDSTMPFSNLLLEEEQVSHLRAEHAQQLADLLRRTYGEYDVSEQLPVPPGTALGSLYTMPNTLAATVYLLQSMLLDRIIALDTRRKNWRQTRGYIRVPFDQVTDGYRACLVCQQPNSTHGIDDYNSPVLQLLCCGAVVEEQCLIEIARKRKYCPACRTPMSSHIREKLFGTDWIDEIEEMVNHITCRDTSRD